jgi:Cu/Zn superoxide dismutase
MAHTSFSRLALVAIVALVGFGTLGGITQGQVASPTAETPVSGSGEVVVDQVVSPVAGTPVSGQEGVNAILRDAAGNAIGYATLTKAVEDKGMVNIFVEVNTFVGLGTLTTGEHGIQVDETGACEAEGDAP